MATLVQIQNVTGPSPSNKTIESLAPNDLVKSCKYIETGTYFEQEGSALLRSRRHLLSRPDYRRGNEKWRRL